MAVDYLNHSESHTGTAGSTSQASFSWTHSVPAAPKGVVVFTFTNANADDATAVTYDGTSLTAVSGGRAVDTAGEPGDCKAWFLGSGVPFTPGSPTVASWGKLPLGSNTWRAVGYGNGIWLIGDTSGNIYCSSAASPVSPSKWTAASAPNFGTNRVYDFAYAQNLYVAVGEAGKIRYATDPTGSWSTPTDAGFSASNVNELKFDGTYWVATGDAGKIRYTTDPTGTWSTPTSPGFGTTNVWGLAYGNGYWVAGADGGKLRYATDPTGTWSAPTSFTSTANIFRIAYANGYWVAVGSGGEILYATDPTGTWSSATSNSTAVFWGVTYADGYWVAGAADGSVRYKAGTDPSGSWSSATTPSGNSAEAVGNVLYANGQWLVGGRFCLLFPGSNPTVSVSRNNNANEMYAVAVTIGADYNVETTGVVLLEGDGTLAEQSVNDGSPGTNSLRLAAINSGLANIVTGTPGANDLAAGANSTWAQSIDYGTRVAGVVYETTVGQGSRSVGFAATTSDDRAAVHLAIREAIVPWTVGVPIL